ncbi:MAG: sugar phosphate isomerase/epimerase [Clostridia bacterium]|nr:sugar phosphate isomerase/epimerase [Clostridia bacterium]
MEAGLNLFSLYKFLGTEDGFADAVDKIKQAGYSYVQYSGGPFDPEMIKRVSEKYSMPVYLTHVPFARIVDDTENLMRDHDVFGCRYIGLGMMPNDSFYNDDLFMENVGKLEVAAEKMSKNGYKFFYHNHFQELKKVNGTTLLEKILVSAPHVHFTIDTYWLQYGGVNVVEFLKKFSGRIECIHLKDYMIAPDRAPEAGGVLKPCFAPVGDGNIDFKNVVEVCKKCGAEYYFVEQDDACTYDDPIAQVSRSIKYIKEEL